MMATNPEFTPRLYPGVMVSSTFTDLMQHRLALINAIESQGMKSIAMEHDSAKPVGDVLDSSLSMVRNNSAYIGVISHKYGQIPDDPERNPDRLSLTELEFNEARRLEQPILLFIMGDDHDVKPADVETDSVKREKLSKFRERAKQLRAGSTVHRVYKVFNSLEEFEVAATQSVAELRRFLDTQVETGSPQRSEPRPLASLGDLQSTAIPRPSALYAEPPYIGSHPFVGRASQLETLNDWAIAADPHPILLFEAIGGTGKSMLTWEWTTKHATAVRAEWAGRFWYSFYEKGAVMGDFCRRALAYMTGQPLEVFRTIKTAELGGLLLQHLQARPWLLVLDGLERVLVAYHRYDAAQLADEAAGTSDEIASRDPCAAIRPEDDDLLRSLAAAAPSKLLLTSRLSPRVLLNAASQPIPGVRHERLPGLRPADAEALLRVCGVRGTSVDIQAYLTSCCDCHPLVTGVLAGLIHDYLPDRGNFDSWAADPAYGGALNLAELSLVQKRNDILEAALAAIPVSGRTLLSMLALLAGTVDFPTLSALNPHLPPAPGHEGDMSLLKRLEAQDTEVGGVRTHHEEVLAQWQQSPEVLAARQQLIWTVRDLERRGLLQYDSRVGRYDLHPVVRGVAAGRLRKEDKENYGQRVVDHFSQRAHDPYEQAETLDDVRDGLNVVRVQLQMGRLNDAYDTLMGELAEALIFNLEANPEILALLHPCFPLGWSRPPQGINNEQIAYITNIAGVSLDATRDHENALSLFGTAITYKLREPDWTEVGVPLTNVTGVLVNQNRLAKSDRCLLLALDLASVMDEPQNLFVARLGRFEHLASRGRWAEAEAMWQLLDPMGRDWERAMYQPGNAEYAYAWFRFAQGTLEDEHLTQAERLAQLGHNRRVVRFLHQLRGEWLYEQERWSLAAESFGEAVRMAREVGLDASGSEVRLAEARLHRGQLPEPYRVAEALSETHNPDHDALSALWLAIGIRERALTHALAAYEWAWADGEPYVRAPALEHAKSLLQQLGVEIPRFPSFDPAREQKLPWEDELEAAIEALRSERTDSQA